MRVEVQVDEASGKVQNAVSSGTAWRGLELVMNGRDPRDAWAYIQRICGVCTTAHGSWDGADFADGRAGAKVSAAGGDGTAALGRHVGGKELTCGYLSLLTGGRVI